MGAPASMDFAYCSDVEGTPGSSMPPCGPGGGVGGAATFSVYCDDKENMDPRFALPSRAARQTTAQPITPGAAAAAARDAGLVASQGPAAEDPKAQDSAGGAHTPRRHVLGDITQYVPAAEVGKAKLRTARALAPGGSAAESCAAAGSHAGAMGLSKPLPRPLSTSLRHSMR